MEGQVVALLVQNLERLDESVKEEADGVHNTLGKWLLHSPLLLSVICTKGCELSLPFPPPLFPLDCQHCSTGSGTAFIQAQLGITCPWSQFVLCPMDA